MSSKASERQQTFTEMMEQYALSIPDDLEIPKKLFDLYKETIYTEVYELIEVIFTDYEGEIPYIFFKNLSTEVIINPSEFLEFLGTLGFSYDYQNLLNIISLTEWNNLWDETTGKTVADHYLEQLQHYLVFCLYCEVNFDDNTTIKEFSILGSDQPPECLSLLMYHGGSDNVQEEPKAGGLQYKDRYFSIAPLDKSMFWDIGFEELIRSVYSGGINKPEQRGIISKRYNNISETYGQKALSIQDEIEFDDGIDIKKTQKELELCKSYQSQTLKLSLDSNEFALKELKPNCIVAFKRFFEGSHPGDAFKYSPGFYVLPKLPNRNSSDISDAREAEASLASGFSFRSTPKPSLLKEPPFIEFLNLYIHLKSQSGDSDTRQQLSFFSKKLDSFSYNDLMFNCIHGLSNNSPIEVKKTIGNRFGTFMYEYFNYFVTTYGDEPLKRYFFALFGCGRSANPDEDDRYIDDYVVPVKFLLDLIQGYCGPSIILDASCNQAVGKHGCSITRDTQEFGGGTRKKKYKKQKKQSKKSKKNKKSKKRRIFRKK
jgi:hypothetical protein